MEIPRWPKEAYNPDTEKMEEVKPPFTYIDDNGGCWWVFDKPITGITIPKVE